MAKHRVQLFNQSRGVEVDTDATPGATVGVNLTLEDGTVVTYDMLFRQPPADSGDPGAVYWRTIMEIPPNVKALAETSGQGMYVVTGQGSSATRALTSTTLDIANGNGVDGDPSVDLPDVPDSGEGTLRAITTDQHGRVTGTRDATITGTDGEIEVADGDAADGQPTISLADVPDAGGGSLRRFDRDAKGRVSGTSNATTDDLEEGAENRYFTDDRADARADVRIDAAKSSPDGVASLVNGKLDPGQLPALAITETFPVFTEGEMLALPAQQGDVAVRIDLDKSFILAAEPASTLSNWQELLSPTAGVTSFNGRTGSIMPATGDYTAAQVGAAASDDPRLTNAREWTASTVSQAEAEAGTATTRRAWTAQRVHQAVRATLLTGLSTATNAAISATDTVLAALGKLQAQVLEKVSKYEPATIQAADPFLLTLESYSDSNAVVFQFRKSRGQSIGAHGLAVPGDQLLGLRSAGSDGAGGWLDGGRLSIVATGAPSQNRLPTEFRFETVNQSGTMRTRWTIEDEGHLNVWADNAYDIGSGANRPRQIYAANGAINTSDAREKTTPRDLSEAERSAAADIARLPVIFRWLHAIEEKGEDARLHASPTVQSVIAAMEAHGLDPFRYGFVCYDQWDEQPEIRDEETGEVTQEYRPAGDRYSLRPTELAAFVMRGLAHRQDELERRLAALEG